MPNHTMFLKYSRKREARGQSCQGFVLHSERKGNLFISPHQPWRPCWKQTWLFGRFPFDNPERFKRSFFFTWGGGSLGGEVCAYHRARCGSPRNDTLRLGLSVLGSEPREGK